MGRSGCGHVSGPLAPYAEGFRKELLEQGYTWGSAAKQVHLMAHASRWLDAGALEPGELTSGAIGRFLEARRAAGYGRLVSPRAIAPLVGYLGELGVVAPERPPTPRPAEALVERYATYLVQERSLAAATVRSYVGVARRFLADLAFDDARTTDDLDAAMVIRFVRLECGRRGAGSAKATVTGVRAWLRFLYLDGRLAMPLAAAVPAVAGWQLAALPKAIGPLELARLFGNCDRRSAPGRRDFAILTVLGRLGLRAGEVAALELGDIDWRGGEIVVRGKGGRHERLPLPVDVGEALVGWLSRGRPRAIACSAVFLRLCAPHGRLRASGVSAVVRRAGRRAGVGSIGAHRLRHTAATQMLQAGGTLTQIGQVLRHRRLVTTAGYAKVDALALAALARPWPEDRP